MESTPSLPNPASEGWPLRLVRLLLVPALLYFVVFCLLTWPLITHFSTHFFTDKGDGKQNIWNIWWVNKAVTELHQLPWHTDWLHFPHGVTLLGQTLNPFNGFLGIPLLRFLSLSQVYNVCVLLAFVAGGVTAFWLAREVTGGYWSALMGGGVFTFSNYHFAHAEGHLQLVSLQWIPLFLLLWLQLLRRPSLPRAFGAAAALFLVILCDYYYFFCCVLTAVLMVVWYAIAYREFLPALRQRYLRPFLAFLIAAAPTSGLLSGSLLWVIVFDGFAGGGHPPATFSLDLLAPFIPGGHWRFASLTKWFWGPLPGVIHESSVHLGLSVIGLGIWTWLQRHRLRVPDLGMWYLIAAFFTALALGPYLQIDGFRLRFDGMPYALAERLFPPLAMGGVPVRFIVITTLCAGVITAVGLRALAASPRPVWLLPVWLALLLVEYLPAPIPTIRPVPPRYVELLQTLPERGAVLDLASDLSGALYWQTLYNRPQAFGYVSRETRSLKRLDSPLRRLLDMRLYGELYPRYRIRYLVMPPGSNAESRDGRIRRLHADQNGELYDLVATAAKRNTGVEGEK